MRRRGFTGVSTIPVSTDLARASVHGHLVLLDPDEDELVVGCCVGMDEMICREGRKMGFRVYGIVPTNLSKVFDDYDLLCTSVYLMPDGTDYMDRNQKIVDISIDLTAFPRTYREERRSGTWSTVRRAYKKPIPVKIIPLMNVEC